MARTIKAHVLPHAVLRPSDLNNSALGNSTLPTLNMCVHMGGICGFAHTGLCMQLGGACKGVRRQLPD